MYNIKRIFAENIKKLRKSRHLSQEKFAEIIGMQWKSIVNFENGRNLPNSENLQNICNKLNIAPYELFISDTKNCKLAQKIQEIEFSICEMDANMLDIVHCIVVALKNKNKN